jgi:hypothetical protein
MWSLIELKEKLNFAPWPKLCEGHEPLEFLLAFTFKANPEDLWFYLADTSRFNRALDFSKRKMREENGGVFRHSSPQIDTS